MTPYLYFMPPIKRLLFIVCLICSLAVHAQTGFYAGLYGGGGISRNTATSQFVESKTIKQLGINIGFTANHLRIESGIQYLETGYKRTDATGRLFNSTGTPPPQGTMHYNFSHIILPVSIGYVINAQGNFRIIPMLGTLVSYNLRTDYHFIPDDRSMSNEHTNFSSAYPKISLGAGARIALEYEISKRIAINITPQFNTIIMEIKPSESGEYHYAATVTGGISFWLKHEAKKKYPKWEDEN